MDIPWPCHRWLWREKSRFEVGVQGRQESWVQGSYPVPGCKTRISGMASGAAGIIRLSTGSSKVALSGSYVFNWVTAAVPEIDCSGFLFQKGYQSSLGQR